MTDPETPTPPKDLLMAAEAGDAEAQTDLGLWYGANLPGTPYVGIWTRRAAAQGLPRAMHNLGVQAVWAGDNELAFEWFRKAVAAGWSNSLFPLGGLLEERGDMSGAIEIYQRGIERDCASSMLAMTRLVIDGEIEKLYPNAHDWCVRAYKQGNIEAHVWLARLYHEGLGVERSAQKAVPLWMTAAQHGHAQAQLMIGLACETGVVLKEDRIAAMRFYSASANQGNEGARICLESLQRKLTPAERAEFEREPRVPADSSASPTSPPPFLFWAAEAGDARSQNELGSWYSKTFPESPLVLMWFQRAADQGDPHGYHNLGVEAYRVGDMETAAKWFEKSTAKSVRKSFAYLGDILKGSGDIAGATRMFQAGAERECPTCQSEFGRLAFYERTHEAYERARYWDGKAAAQGEASSQTRLGIMLKDGLGGDPDPEQAVHWWTQAAQQGNRTAQYLLGVAYHKGAGTKKDRLAAMRLLRASAAQDTQYARDYLPMVEADLTSEERSQLANETTAAML
ncbi:MAG: tetratricopeptide repeat protein [Pseudomonadota bacterium]